MAPKRQSPFEDRPAAAAASSEEDETSRGEDEEASEEGNVDFALKKHPPLLPPSASATDKKAASKKRDPPMISEAQRSSSAFGSEAESDDEAGKNVKPSSRKPMEKTHKRQKLKENADTMVRPSVIRPSQSKEKKMSLLGDGAVREQDSKDQNKKLFQRVWSEADEIVILKGIRHFTKKKGIEHYADMYDLHDFIKKYLHVEASRLQLQDKVRRLKKKYQNNVRRGKKGEDPTFTKPHEQKAFELAKLVCGDKVETPFPEQPPMVSGSQRESRRKPLKKELLGMPKNLEKNYEMEMHAEGERAPSQFLNELLDFNKNRGVLGLPENVVKQGLKLIEEPKKAELAAQLKRVYLAELELFVRRTELLSDQSRLIMEAYKSSN